MFGDPLPTSGVTTGLGWVLVIAFAGWNGWALLTMAHHRTGLLPGATTVTIIGTGPFALSRNPLYVGLLALSAGLSLLAGSLWALLLLPVEWALLQWGAVLPEERYLTVEVRDVVRRVHPAGAALALIAEGGVRLRSERCASPIGKSSSPSSPSQASVDSGGPHSSSE